MSRQSGNSRRRISYRRQSRKGYMDSPQLERRHIKKYSNILLSECGVTLKILRRDSDILRYMDSNGMRAGFSSYHRIVYIRRDATYFELAHEMKHARHWANLGEGVYDSLSILQKETYVFEALMEEKHNLTSKEMVDAYRYINKIRSDFGINPLPPDVLLP